MINIVIASFNREDALYETLKALSVQETDVADWRVIVVNNACTDNTNEMLQRFKASSQLNLVVLNEPQPGKSRALNRALDHISAGLVVFMDDDVALRPDFIQNYINAVKRWPDYSIFGGKIIPAFPNYTPYWLQDERYVPQAPMFSRYNPLDDEGETTVLPLGPNLAIRREAISSHRFDETLGPGSKNKLMGGDETEFVRRLARYGNTPFVYVPKAEVEHKVRSNQLSKAAILYRAYSWGRSKAFSESQKDMGVTFSGVPLKYYVSTLRSFLRYLVAYCGPVRYQVKYGWKYWFRYGRLSGCLEKYNKTGRR